MIKTTRINTPLGEMIAAATEEGICLLEFSDDRIINDELTELKELLRVKKTKEGRGKHLRHLKKQLKD